MGAFCKNRRCAGTSNAEGDDEGKVVEPGYNPVEYDEWQLIIKLENSIFPFSAFLSLR